MDFGDKDELDFEEELPENEPAKNNEPQNAEVEKKEDPELNGCDQYLQIDCLEDEDLLPDISSETEKPEDITCNKEPDVKYSGRSENELSEKKKSQENYQDNSFQTSNFGKINCKKRKKRPFGLPLYQTHGSVCSNRWRSHNNFARFARKNNGRGLNPMKGLPMRYPKLHHFSQNYLQSQNEFVSLLGLSASKNQCPQQINTLFPQYSNPVLEVSKNLIRNGVLGQCSNMVPNQFQCNDFSRFNGALELKPVADVNGNNFPIRFANGFNTNYNRGNFHGVQHDKGQVTSSVLPLGEKELVKSKKEARLLRFKNDETAKKENKSSENVPGVAFAPRPEIPQIVSLSKHLQKPFGESLDLEEEYFKKMEEQKRKRQEIFNLKEKQKADCSSEGNASHKAVINKEFLLRKENPFENSVKTMWNRVKFEVKEEKGEVENVSQNESALRLVKKEMESSVKFVRTVSKSFEELGLSKTKSRHFPDIDRNGSVSHSESEFEKTLKMAALVNTASQTEMEHHLTGCIVKIINVPASTTSNDVLALCSPFGNVREMKVNLPKENSVAIRFGEPRSAENFFKLYNGRVIDGHTLNVITV